MRASVCINNLYVDAGRNGGGAGIYVGVGTASVCIYRYASSYRSLGASEQAAADRVGDI